MVLSLVVTIQAQEIPVYEGNTDITISVPCTTNGSYCSGSASCSSTIIDPDGVLLINNQAMTKNDAVFEINLTANQTELNGQYEFNIVCSDLGNSYTRFLNFQITPNGETTTTAKGILFFGAFIVLIIFFVLSVYGFIHSSSLPIRLLLFYCGWVLLIALSFIAWNGSTNFLTSAPFLIAFFRIIYFFFVIATFPLILISFVWVGYMMITVKEVRHMMDKGIPEDEAYHRVKSGRRN